VAQRPSDGLRLAVEPSAAEVVLGEPVYVALTLRNASGQSVRVVPDLGLESGLVRVNIEPETGEPFSFIPLAIADSEVAPEDLAPGAEIAEVAEVFFGGSGWTFETPGSYVLTATYEAPGGPQLRSAPATLRVTEGDGAGRHLLSAEASTLREAGKFMVWQQGDHLRRAQTHLTGLIEQYPESRVADHARLALGINLSQSFYDATAAGVRPPRPEEALGLLDAIDEERLPDVLRLRLQLARARSLAALGRDDEASAAVRAARLLAAGRPALQSVLQQQLETEPQLRENGQ
jgi:hypothetical protein